MYNPYHEMDISAAILKMRELSQNARVDTYLKKLSQSQLAEETGIPVKTIVLGRLDRGLFVSTDKI